MKGTWKNNTMYTGSRNQWTPIWEYKSFVLKSTESQKDTWNTDTILQFNSIMT